MVAVAIGGAVVGVVGAGASIAEGDKAAKTAKDAANSNNALQEDIYNKNSQALAPYEAQGGPATMAINSLLGLGGTSTPNYAGYVQNSPDLLAAYNATGKKESMAQWGMDHWNSTGQYEGRSVTPQSTATGGTSATGAQDQAFANFRNSTGYQFQLDQGAKQVQAALGAKGLLDSGADQKALLNYGQQAALGSFQNYYGDLTGQQNVGLTAASAQAGVGQNYANAVTSNNNAAATASGNADLNTGNQINSALGNALSAFSTSQALGSSYGSGGNEYGAVSGIVAPSGSYWGGK